MKRTILLVAAVALCLCPAANAQYVTLCYESFDYAPGGLGGLGGGTGWANTWWSGGGQMDALITTPGMDTTGNKATTNFDNAGSYRVLDATNWPDQTFSGRFGTDGSTLWIRFRTQRTAGGDDQYGGLSLNEQFVGEKLFIGSPWMSGQLGYQDQASAGAPSATVPTSNVDVATAVVIRIDYNPGMEHMRMWLNPTENYPCGPADLDTMIGDHLFNEIRLQSGGGTTLNGWDFDEIHFEIKAGELTTDADCFSAAAGGTVTLFTDVGPTYAGQSFAVAGSASGTTPGLPIGGLIIPLNQDFYFDLMINSWNVPPFNNTMGVLDANGRATSTITVPPGIAGAFAGQTLHHATAVVDFTQPLVLHVTNTAPTAVIP